MIRGVFFDLGGTLRICDPAPEHQAAAARRMAELAGADDPEAFLKRIDAVYEEKDLEPCDGIFMFTTIRTLETGEITKYYR